MSEKDVVEDQIKEFLKVQSTLKEYEKLNYLMSIFDKHFAFSQKECTIEYMDFNNIIDAAKEIYTKQNVPMHITGKRIDDNHLVHVAMIESFIRYLNGNELLKKLPKMNYNRK